MPWRSLWLLAAVASRCDSVRQGTQDRESCSAREGGGCLGVQADACTPGRINASARSACAGWEPSWTGARCLRAGCCYEAEPHPCTHTACADDHYPLCFSKTRSGAYEGPEVGEDIDVEGWTWSTAGQRAECDPPSAWRVADGDEGHAVSEVGVASVTRLTHPGLSRHTPGSPPVLLQSVRGRRCPCYHTVTFAPPDDPLVPVPADPADDLILRNSVVVVPQLLSPEECATLIAAAAAWHDS